MSGGIWREVFSQKTPGIMHDSMLCINIIIVYIGLLTMSISTSLPDVDECATVGSNDCDTNAFCTNTPGSYTCACKSGWTGSGMSGYCKG
jgi:hypothetical protein